MNKLLSVTLIVAALFALGACRRSGPPPFSGYDEIKEVLVANSSEIQEHIDRYFSIASSWLNDRRNQQEIVNLLRRAEKIARLVNFNLLEEALLETVDDAFNVLEKLQSKLNKTFQNILALPDIPEAPLLYSNPEDRSFRRFNDTFREFSLSSYQMNVTRNFIQFRNESLEELDNLKSRIYARFAELAANFFWRLSGADQETALEVLRLIRAADDLFIRDLEWRLRRMFKLDHGAQIVGLIESFRPGREGPIQNRVRNIVRDMASDLNRINLQPLRNLSRNLVSVVLDDLQDTRRQLESASYDALRDWEDWAHLYQDDNQTTDAPNNSSNASNTSDASDNSSSSWNTSDDNSSFWANDTLDWNSSEYYSSQGDSFKSAFQYAFSSWNSSRNSSWGYYNQRQGPPGRIISNALDRLREGLGDKLANFRQRLLKDIHGVLRNALRAVGYTNVPEINDPNLPSKTHIIVEKIKRRVEEIISVIRRVWKEEDRYSYYGYGYGYGYN